MSRLDELLQQYCPNGVEYKPLSSVITVDRGKRVVREQLPPEGKYVVYQNSLAPLGFIDDYNFSGNKTFVIGAGAAGEIGYSYDDFWAADDCYPLVCSNVLNDRFVYHFIMNNKPYIMSQVRRGSIPRLSRTVIEKMVIPVPPLVVQEEIVRVLDAYTERVMQLKSQLTEELAKCKVRVDLQKNKLWSFDETVPYERLDYYFPSIRNGFVGTITKHFSDKENGVRYLEGRNVHAGVISNDDEIYVTQDFHQQHLRTALRLDDIVMVQSGHVGECAVVGPDIVGANCHALIIMSNGGECNSRFMMHYFMSDEGKRKLARITTGETVKHILASAMQKFMVPAISRDEQDRIVVILDRLDATYAEFREKLLAEITARQKQYEYYRDKLLSFESIT